MIFTSLTAAVIPMLIYLLLLWKFDKYEPEPIKFVLFHFLWGATLAVIIGFTWSKLVSIPLNLLLENSGNAGIFQIILVAPVVEEISKGILLFRTVKDKRFNNLTDGLVYGGAIGLGFGMTENFLYFITFGDSITNLVFLILIRSAFSAVMHAMATASFGALLSMSKYDRNNNRKLLIVVGFISAISIHFIWNFSMSFSYTFLFGLFFMVIIFVLFIFVFNYSLNFEKRIIKEKLEEIVPKELLQILMSTFRNRKGWFEESLRREFIFASINLAFRKHELDIDQEKSEFYNSEITILEKRVTELLKLNKETENTI